VSSALAFCRRIGFHAHDSESSSVTGRTEKNLPGSPQIRHRPDSSPLFCESIANPSNLHCMVVSMNRLPDSPDEGFIREGRGKYPKRRVESSESDTTRRDALISIITSAVPSSTRRSRRIFACRSMISGNWRFSTFLYSDRVRFTSSAGRHAHIQLMSGGAGVGMP
jgi:hypothetical protein